MMTDVHGRLLRFPDEKESTAMADSDGSFFSTSALRRHSGRQKRKRNRHHTPLNLNGGRRLEDGSTVQCDELIPHPSKASNTYI